MEDLIASTETIKFSSAGVGSASFTDTKLLAEAFELNIQVIPGFDGTEGEMAMMRGEICAQFGTTSSLKPFVDSGYGSFIMTIGGEIEGVPNGMEFARTERAREIVELMETLAQLGRATAAPPNTPADRLQVLQDAYREALQDPELLAEAEKLGFPIEYTHGDEVKRMIMDALDQKPEIVEVIGKVLNL
jgi:tripartite-type tricarboxylate transporter receptor subunit TctC